MELGEHKTYFGTILLEGATEVKNCLCEFDIFLL